MKPLVLFTLILIASIAKGQDTLLLTTGKTITGQSGNVYNDRLLFTDTTGNTYMIEAHRIKSMSLLRTVTDYTGSSFVARLNSFNQLKPLSLGDFKTPEYHLKKAGAFGIAGISLLVVSTSLTSILIGALSNDDKLQLYTTSAIASGLGAVSVGLSIAAWTHVKRSSRAVNYKVL